MSSPVMYSQIYSDPELSAGLPGGEDVMPVPVDPDPPGTGSPRDPAERIPGHVARRVLSGTSALGLGTFLERGMGFLANILAARLGGAQTFGAYSLAITTANNISTYAAGGIGATAARFSGKYPYGTAGYPTLARALVIVSAVSAGVALLALWLGAAPIAHLLREGALTNLLRWAAVSAMGMILLECARGFFVGQRRLPAVVLLSALVAAGLLALLPVAAAQHRPVHMIVAQGCVTLMAVAICLLLARPLRLISPADAPQAMALGPVLREVWGFGFVQLAGLIAANLAGWWVTALVARADTSLVQMGFFAIASQLRNLTGLFPSLVTEGSYAAMADPEGEHAQTPQNVMALCNFASTAVSMTIASVGIVIVPWVLRLAYGKTYQAAAVTAAAGLMVAVLHMGNAPVAARLTIISIRATAVINTIFAAFVAGAGTLLMLHGGSAAEAMGIFGAAHLLISGLVLWTLGRKDWLPQGMVALYALSSSTVVVLVGLAALREHGHVGALTGLMSLVVLASLGILLSLGRRYGWLPARAVLVKVLQNVKATAERLRRGQRKGVHGHD